MKTLYPILLLAFLIFACTSEPAQKDDSSTDADGNVTLGNIEKGAVDDTKQLPQGELSIPNISGSGKIVKKEFPVGAFTALNMQGNYNLILTEGGNSVEIETDDNLMERLSVTSVDGMLNIQYGEIGIMESSRGTTVRLGAEALTNIQLFGTIDLQATNTLQSEVLHIFVQSDKGVKLDVDCKELKLRGKADDGMKVTGKTSLFITDLTSNTHLDALGLEAEQVKIFCTGNCSADVHCTKRLDVRTTGNAVVRYKGNPEITRQELVSEGSLRKI